MAVKDVNGRLHGRVGSVIYRTIGTTEVVQSRPRKFKQTLATRQSGLEFGLGSNTARILRQMLWPVYHSVDRGMANRLTSSVLSCIRACKDKACGERDLHDGELSYLRGFQFNRNSPLSKVLRVRPEVKMAADGKPEICIPAFNEHTDLQCPVGRYEGITIRFMAVAFHFRSEYCQYLGYQDVWIDRRAAVDRQVWKVEKELPAGSIVLLTVSLIAGTEKLSSPVTLNSKEWSPAEIVDVIKVSQGDAALLSAEYINKLAGRDEQDPSLPASEPLLTKHPMACYWGKSIFGKVQRLREKADLQQLQKSGRQQLRQSGIASGGTLILPEGKVEI